MVVLPTPPFGLKTAIVVALPMPAAEVAALEDRAAAVVDGLAPDAHRLDPPADRVGRVGPREVFVERVGLWPAAQALEGARRDDGQGRDRPPGAGEHGVVGLGLGGIDLAIEDGQGDVATDVERLLELARRLDLDDLETGREQLGGDGRRLAEREGDGDGGTGHGGLLGDPGGGGQEPASGSCAATSRSPELPLSRRASKPGRATIASPRPMPES